MKPGKEILASDAQLTPLSKACINQASEALAVTAGSLQWAFGHHVAVRAMLSAAAMHAAEVGVKPEELHAALDLAIRGAALATSAGRA